MYLNCDEKKEYMNIESQRYVVEDKICELIVILKYLCQKLQLFQSKFKFSVSSDFFTKCNATLVVQNLSVYCKLGNVKLKHRFPWRRGEK